MISAANRLLQLNGNRFIFDSTDMRLIQQKIFILLLCFSFTKFVSANDTTLSPIRIAVLAPLYLDSAFNGTEYNLSNTKIPQFFLEGLEFYNGVKMAIDSLQKENANIEVWIYDTHKRGQSIQQLLSQMQSLNFSLIIASLSSLNEQKYVSDFSGKNSIPVISETYPTNAYLSYNPFFAMVNPTWQTHINAIYHYLENNYRNQKIIYFTRNGSLENAISKEFAALNKNRSVNFSNIILNDNFSANDVLKHLDSNKQNIVVCGTLNENFGRSLIRTLNDTGATYHSVVMGMPTWSGLSETTGSTADKIQILISTCYDYLRDSTGALYNISEKYRTNFFARPSDMVFKGFESMYHFTKLLLKYPDNLINNISDTSYTVCSTYDFQPIRITKTSFIPDYLENKKIYFIRIVNGEIQSIQ
jgi:ABC-type branched-subunit amino acid transport system substrate-binding protein